MFGAPAATVAHNIRGRLRIRIPEKQGDVAYFAEAADGLRGRPGIRSVQWRAFTGSLVITHDSDVRAIAAEARRRGLFVIDADRPDSTSPLPPVAASERWLSDLAELNRRYVAASGGRGDIGTLLTALFLVIAVVQATRGRIAMPAVSALWYAVRALSLTRQWPDPSTGPK